MEDRPRRRRGTGRRRRLDPETARAQLLAAGIELAGEQPLGETLGHLRVNDIARDAGLTSGAFYHYWDGQEAYRTAVLEAALAGLRADAEVDLLTPRRDDGDGAAAVVDAVVRRAAGTLVEDPRHRLELTLWTHDDPRLRPRLAQRWAAAEQAHAHAVGRCLAHAGRAPGPDWTPATLGTAAAGLTDGLRTLSLIDPGALADRGRWSTPGLLALLFLLGASEDGPPAAVPEPPRPEPVADDGPSGRRRRRLVDLGVAAALERPTGDAFGHLRAEDVARRLDLTIGAFYHYWERQDDYRDDLVDALFAADLYVDPTAVADDLRRVVGTSDLDTALRDATNRYWSVAAGNPDNRIQFAVHTLDDPYISPRRAAWNASLRAGWDALLDDLLARCGRQLRAPLTTDLVVLGMSVSLDGLVVRHDLDPAGLEPDAEGWTLWGRLCRALVHGATVAVDDGDDRDLPTLADQALGPPG